jgi:uncharacterized protein (TIGR03000 family)
MAIPGISNGVLSRLLAVTVAALCASKGFAEDEVIKLKNGLANTPVTVLILAAQQNAPTEIHLLVDGEFDFPLKWDGPYSIQIVPDDLPDTGHDLKNRDLKKGAKELKGMPYYLRGDVRFFVDLRTGQMLQARVAAFFDVPTQKGFIVERSVGPQVSYVSQEVLAKQAKAENQPDDHSAAIKLFVPEDAKVSVGDWVCHDTGAVRFIRTPRLPADKESHYDIRCDWKKDGKSVTETKKVSFRPGDLRRVYFRLPIDECK